jgi:DNA-binding CsgD family transcriptional regulator
MGMGENLIKSTVDKSRVLNQSSTRKPEETQANFSTNRVSSQFNGSASFSDFAWEEVRRTLKLSGRETQIVQGMFNDKIQYSIASDLGISPHTVHSHIVRLYNKLGVSNRAQLLIRIMTVFVDLAGAAKPSTPADRALRPVVR